MKSPIQELIQEFDFFAGENITKEDVLQKLKDIQSKEKQQLVTAFNCGIREEFENGMDYYNNVYDDRI